MKLSRPLLLISGILLFSFFSSSAATPARDSLKEQFRFRVGGGFTFSAINLLRNPDDTRAKHGFEFRSQMELKPALRISGSYSRNFELTTPTWANITSVNYDLNLQFVAHFRESGNSIYFFTGGNMNRWKGRFTGFQDFFDIAETLAPGTWTRETYLGLNFGTGLEKNWKHSNLYGKFKFRLTSTELGFSISDVVYTVGYVITPNKIFRFPRGIYKWVRR